VQPLLAVLLVDQRLDKLEAMERLRLTTLFDRAAPLYDTVEPRFFREIARRLVARISDRCWYHVLDVATGPGVVLAEIARIRASRARLVGVDISPGMVREARTRLSAAGARVDVLVMDAEHLAFLDGQFDLVTMSRAYMQPQRRAILREIRRVLRPGGIVTIAEFGRLDGRWSWKNDLYARLLPQLPGSGRPTFNAQILARELDGAGLRDIQVESDDLDVTYASLEDWWESSMSHGERGALELMDDRARGAFFEQADPSRCLEEDGRLHWRSELLFGIALR
jgi:ubiquinone/menaquinone biosynthesis C-methylase UbiE